MVGTVVKAKVGELEEEIREVFLRGFSNEMTGVVKGFFFEEEVFSEVPVWWV